MRRAIKWLDQHRIERGLVWPEIMFALILLAWGIAFLNPTTAFTLTNNYNALAAIASETDWGIGLALFGAIWVALIIVNRGALRHIFGVIGATVLLWMAISIYLSNPNSTWAGPTSIIGVFAVYSAVRQVTLWTRLRR